VKGLMQDVPLTLELILRRLERGGGRGVVCGYSAEVVERGWAEVAERARRVGGALRALGIEPGASVATFAHNDLVHLELLLGVPAAGRVLCPVNIRLHEDDIAYVVARADAPALFVAASLTPVLAELRERLEGVERFVVIDDGPPAHQAFEADARYEQLIADAVPERCSVGEDEAALVCFTSGTTGRPRGVVATHRSTVLHALQGLAADSFGVHSGDVVLPVTPIYHAAAWGLPLSAGWCSAGLALASGDSSPSHLADLIARAGVTLAAGVPTIWVGLSELLHERAADLATLTDVISGGSSVPPSLIARFARAGVRLRQGWGMTELSPSGAMSRRGGPDADAGVGRPVPGIELRMCDEAGRELDWDGASVGELQVRGPWVASAYLRPDDDANTRRFDRGWLRTGDLATITPAGEVRIVDRVKDLIKSGGEWIPSLRLERALADHPAVAEAAVVAVPDERWGERPLAVVVVEDGCGVAADELRAHLAARVARWWLPDRFEFREQLPRTRTGKLDKRALRGEFAAAARAH
jgi:fatty-acyl-CoA synthase